MKPTQLKLRVKSLKKVDMSTSNMNSSLGKMSEKIVRTSSNSSLGNSMNDAKKLKLKFKPKQ